MPKTSFFNATICKIIFLFVLIYIYIYIYIYISMVLKKGTKLCKLEIFFILLFLKKASP